MSVRLKIRFVLLSVFIAAVLFTACDSPLGMGKPIDWEPPVLTISPKPPSPMYVKLGANLTGTVTDNVGVDRVILRDSTNGKQLFTAQLLSDNRWRIDLDFSPDQNGETILADVVAFDTAGNSGAESIASVVLIIDIRPPVINDIWIQRTNIRTADLVPFTVFTDPKDGLEKTDPNGELINNVEFYQNGIFYIKAKISEEDTNIENVELSIYDERYPDTALFSLKPDAGFSNFSPQWLFTEDMILAAGESKLPLSNYTSDYKDLNKRYYYRVRITALDRSKNDSVNDPIIEDKDYFCLWNKADDPKGILDTRVVGMGSSLFITKGSTLPVDFFDDDRLDWAYAALFTKEQWAGTAPIASDTRLPTTNDAERFSVLQNRLRTKQPVFNWRYDRYVDSTELAAVKNQLNNPVDEKVYYEVTGNSDADYGDFVFVTLVKDVKAAPYDALKSSPFSAYPARTIYRKYDVTLIDENAPLIVFDKENGSPEENTFPQIDANGKFKIHGYTLREDKTLFADGTNGLNGVVKFRLAWIPFGISNEHGGAEKNIPTVREALEKGNGFPEGVQWWDLDSEVSSSLIFYPIPANPAPGEKQNIYRKQLFSKEFDILGGQDDRKPEYNNFTYNGKLENNTKLFIFYAEDNMGHVVFTQFYLLGNRTPPTLDIYDITDKLILTAPDVPPNIYDAKYSSPLGVITPQYIADRDAFIKAKFPVLRDLSLLLTNNDLALSYRAYPKGTIIKFWASAKANGNLAIKSIKMEDTTSELPDPSDSNPNPAHPTAGHFELADSSLGYVEYFPDVTQRVFLFTVTDSLDNVLKVQRTVAIANAATLTSITTSKQNGTYPAGEVVELKANFDGMIKLQSTTAGTRPKLNVMYKNGSTDTVMQIECENDAALAPNANGQLALNFKFTVPENAAGRLETVYMGFANPQSLDRPITVNANNRIIDALRGDSAYTPGNVIGFFWNTEKNSLQEVKSIRLDGVIPTVTGFSLSSPKTPSSGAGTSASPYEYFYKSGESLSIELTASKNLKVSGDASLSFKIQPPTGAAVGPNNTVFDYRRVNGNKILFTLDVSSANIINNAHGRLVLENALATLFNSGNITDDVGNKINVTPSGASQHSVIPFLISFGNNNQIFFDLQSPPLPVTTLEVSGGGTGFTLGATSTAVRNYSITPYLSVGEPSTAEEPYGFIKKQYSLNGGLRWVDFPNADAEWGTTKTSAPDPVNNIYIPNGQWTVRTRFIDRAGNEGTATEQNIHVNNVFPKLIGVNVRQPNATYIGGQTLVFALDFDDVITADPGELSNIKLQLKDITASSNTVGGSNNTYESPVLNPAAVASGRTLEFTWALGANTKDMLNGLALMSLDITRLKDKFGNYGPATGSITNTTVTITGSAALNYNLSGVKVSTINPQVTARTPASAQGRTGNITASVSSVSSDNSTIRLTFSKPVQKGNGTITIRPRGSYAIPAVFEHEGYYISYTYDASGNVTGETRSSSAGTGRSYVSGFSDIFNNANVNNTDKENLIGGTSMNNPKMSNVTGLSVGPYLKTTHGLKLGAGYTGYYGNASTPTDALPGINAPGTRGTTFMVPDIESKWVLHYQYNDLFSDSATTLSVLGPETLPGVRTIRDVLNKAKWRWQEISVTAASVVVDGTNLVVINLPEPLLPGLQWDVYYPEGTFTDQAGNKAVKSGDFTSGATNGTNNDYWFWSRGVQKPVIRVDRKSFDARASANYNKSTYDNGFSYNATGYNGNIASFNTIAYMITTETPQARIFHGTLQGKNFTGNGAGSVMGAWTGNAVGTTDNTLQIGTGTTANGNAITWTTITWNGTKNAASQAIGVWVRPNLIFRHRQDGNYYTMASPNVAQKVGGIDTNTDSRWFAIEHQDNGGLRYYGFRSYNRDATETELNNITITSTVPPATPPSVITSSFTGFGAYEASKNYLASIARIDHANTGGTYSADTAISSQRGFEGVFRTVVMMNQTGLRTDVGYTNTSTTPASGSNGGNPITTGSLPMMIAGTNVRSGLPTVSGFPLKDGSHNTDSRYVKFFFRDETNSTTNGTDGKQFYWVTSEIVCQWYIQIVGRGNGKGSSSLMGDVEDWMSAGYGDLTYALNLATW